MQQKLDPLIYTYDAWTQPLSFGYDWNDQTLYNQPQDIVIYNASEAISQDFADVFYPCTLGFYQFGIDYYIHY